MRFTHAPIISLTCAFYPRTYCQFILYVFGARTYYYINLCVNPVRFTHATIANSTCAFLQHLCISPVCFTHTTRANSSCAFLQHLCESCAFYAHYYS